MNYVKRASDFGIGAVSGGFLSLLAWLFISAIAELYPRKHLLNEAVSVGVAEYYLDEDHNKQFRWITNQSKVKP